MRAFGITVIAAACATLPVTGGGPPSGVAACALPPQLELEIRAASADDLPAAMQHAVDAVRAAFAVSVRTAPADGVGIEPLVSPKGPITGYSAINRLTLPAPLLRNHATFVRAEAAAARFLARVSLVEFGEHQVSQDAWVAQWLRDG